MDLHSALDVNFALVRRTFGDKGATVIRTGNNKMCMHRFSGERRNPGL